MSKSKSSADDKSRGKNASAKDESKPHDGGWRETVESIAMAVILALLFRGFVAEAFVIPTGSMAPTLRGRHKDVQCPECGLWYQVGASQEVGGSQDDERDVGKHIREVIAGLCPSCRFTQPFNRFENPNDGSFSGDRIIVSKYLYDFRPPQRWDVIVFKFPGDATQNYIKRLIGLPNETVRIEGGNIWVRRGTEGPFRIARKPPDKLRALLQLVSDSDHVAASKLDAKWPADWIEGTPIDPPAEEQWIAERTGAHSVAYLTDGNASADTWIRYRHLLPTGSEWNGLLSDPPSLPDRIAGIEGELITDFSAYNDYNLVRDTPKAAGTLEPVRREAGRLPYKLEQIAPLSPRGEHWVDDLAVECLADVESETGELLLDVVRAGVHHVCRIDVASGVAKLARVDENGQSLGFTGGGEASPLLSGQTPIRGAGSYRVRLSNCDHEVLLWVNGSVVKFSGETTYDSPPLVTPKSTDSDYGDLLPIGIGSNQLKARVSQLRVFRDVYYIAQKDDPQGNEWSPRHDWEPFFQTPEFWTEDLFLYGRDAQEFSLGPDQFFPMGDNSAQSQDARTWPHGGKMRAHNYVERDLLIGKAMFVYWPHTWNAPIPFMPNPMQMRPIR